MGKVSVLESVATRTATVERLSSGIVAVRVQCEAVQSVADAKENIGAAVKLGLPGLRPLLVDIRGCQPLEADTRHYYSGKILSDSFLALCILLDLSPLGQMMGNLYLRVAKPGVPTRLSMSESEALSWLAPHLEHR